MAITDIAGSYDAAAGDWTRRVRTGKKLAHDFLERPAMRALLPRLDGLRILCLGCGSGEECQYLKEHGAARVVGIDISRGLIENAKYAFPDCEFAVMDMEKLEFGANQFDLVFSSLALHYLPNWQQVLAESFRVLRSGGEMIFSTHHPVKWGSFSGKEPGQRSIIMGYRRFDSKEPEIYGDYLNARMISDNLMGNLKVNYYHRPFGEMLNDIIRSGFELVEVVEPKAAPGAKTEKNDFWAVHQKIPLFVIFKLKKRG